LAPPAGPLAHPRGIAARRRLHLSRDRGIVGAAARHGQIGSPSWHENAARIPGSSACGGAVSYGTERTRAVASIGARVAGAARDRGAVHLAAGRLARASVGRCLLLY